MLQYMEINIEATPPNMGTKDVNIHLNTDVSQP